MLEFPIKRTIVIDDTKRKKNQEERKRRKACHKWHCSSSQERALKKVRSATEKR